MQDGLEASRRIRDKYAPHERPRIIALSADTLQALHDRCGGAALCRAGGRGAPAAATRPCRPDPLALTHANQPRRRPQVPRGGH
jgi:CheY-like chemotaxis protein